MDPEPAFPLPNSYEEAINKIDIFKNDLLNEAGNNSMILSSLNSVKPGQI
jgi:hypothetical protein